jgi:hypothetical protein
MADDCFGLSQQQKRKKGGETGPASAKFRVRVQLKDQGLAQLPQNSVKVKDRLVQPVKLGLRKN